MVSRETIHEYYEYIEMTCPDALKPAKKLNNTIDTSDSNAIAKIESELNTKKENTQSPTPKNKSMNDKRIECIKKHLELLEQAAEAKGITFDREKLNCSKKQILEWLANKDSKLFKKGNSYTTTIPAQILWDIDTDKPHNVVFTFDKSKRKWYLEFEGY